MRKFSDAYCIGKTQPELDFVDVDLETDSPLFVDPFAISVTNGDLAAEANGTIISFFQQVVDAIRRGQDDVALELLTHLREPNETRLGYSRAAPRGAGIGSLQAGQLLGALKRSRAVASGLLESLEECELLIPGISWDKVSDIATNVIRGHLVDYSAMQCQLHGIPMQEVALPPRFNASAGAWESGYVELPVPDDLPVLLVPKRFVRRVPSFDHRKYYRGYVLDYLQAEALSAHSSLVRAVRTRRGIEHRVRKGDVAERYPCSKQFLLEFSEEHPEVLREYKGDLQEQIAENPEQHCDADEARSVGDALLEVLRSIPLGHAGADDYHKLMIGVVEFVFFPDLIRPRGEVEIHDGRKRIDIVMDNAARDGIFYRLPSVRSVAASYVVFECKNYTRDIRNPELDQIQGRFSRERGQVGFVCCRRMEDRDRIISGCRDTLRDGRGLVIPLDDATVVRFIELSMRQDRVGVRQLVNDLVDEIYLA